MKIAIGNDHVAVEMKKELKAYLEEKGYEMIDAGTNQPGSFDYPISGYRVAKMVAAGEADLGICICGTGLGISMAANKVKGARAALCHDPYSAKMTRLHNDANILCMGGLVIGNNLALEITEVFLNTDFSGEERHQRRIDLIED